MVTERRLFERLKHAGKSDERSAHLSTQVMADSVLQHLRKILNMRQGSVPTRPDFGLPDFNDMFFQFSNAVPEIQQEIKRCIELYEPRLDNVRIEDRTDQKEPFNLRFEITARLLTGEGETAVRFETSLERTGRVRIEDKTVDV